MTQDSDYRITVVESQGQPLDLRQRGAARATPRLSPHAAVAAVRATSGADELIAQIPNLADASQLQETAFFSVCTKTGTAGFLDLWDVDHYDFFTDLQSSLNNCSAWFSPDGFDFYGAPQGKTGRVNCTFQAPVDGTYLAIASLVGDGGNSATVRYILDDFGPGSAPTDLGAFVFTGPVNQAFVLSLTANSHSVRIDQEAGGFFFSSLTLYQA
jgi:hypothetical protein